MIKDFQPRLYQQTILGTIANFNSLIVLPTGLGKTALAFLLAAQRLRLYPNSKILMLAPTKPLCEQHINTFKKHLNIPEEKIVLFTGSVKPEKRAEMWKEAQVIISTPQGLENDTINRRVKLEEVSLLVFDEAHHTTGEYSYVWIAQQYEKLSNKSRILALTASPGSDLDKIREVCTNLKIEKVEVRTDQDPDVKPYVQDVKVNWIKVKFPEELKRIHKLLTISRTSKLMEAQHLGYCKSPKLNKGDLLKLQGELQKKISSGERDFDVLRSVSLIAEALKVDHATELLESQGVSPLQTYLNKLKSESRTSNVKAVKNLMIDENFKTAMFLTEELSNAEFYHPKLVALQEMVNEQIQKDRGAKIIIFTQFRDSAQTIISKLEELRIKSHIFFGQAKKNGVGFSQKQQKEILDKFRNDEFNVLVATSVHPDEYIVVKNLKDEIELVQIGHFVNKLQGKSLKGWSALTGDDKEVGFYPITNVFKHKRRSKVVDVKLSSGFNCLITEDHSIFSFNEDGKIISAKPEKDLFANLLFSAPNPESIKEVDLVRELNHHLDKKDKKEIFCLVNGLNQSRMRKLSSELKTLNCINIKTSDSNTKVAKLSGLDISTITNVTKRLFSKKYILLEKRGKGKKYVLTSIGTEYLSSLSWLFNNMKYHKGKYRVQLSPMETCPPFFRNYFGIEVGVWYGKTTLPRFLTLNEHLAKFLGFYVSEGHARKTIKMSEVYLAARVKKMQQMMDESIRKGLGLVPAVSWRGVRISSQMAFHLVTSVLRSGIGSYNKEIPNVLFSASKKIKWAFLEAYFLGDGYFDKERGRIVLTTVSKKLAIGLVLMLRQLGIKHITLRREHAYRVNIYESLPFAKMKSKISTRSYYSLMPQAINDKDVFADYKNKYSKEKKRRISCRRTEIIKSPTHFDYIKEISVLKKQPEYVYDIEVKNKQRFVGGTGLISLHNSVAEEGLDIPKVDKVIFYEPVPSAIRSIQRRGRTGRLEEGAVSVLITEGTRDEAYRWASFHKERKMYTNLEKIRKGFILDKEETTTLDKFIPQDQPIAILADHREKGNRIVKELIDLGISVKTEQLTSADYLVSGKVGVELKKVPDFVASIIDGRLLSQARELKQNFEKAVLIIEGEEDIYSIRKVHANAIRGMLATLVLDFGIPVLYTKYPKDTAALLAVMAKREQDKNREFSYHAAKPRSIKEQQEFIVSSLPGMGVQTARLLLENFKSIKSLVNSSEKDLISIKGIGEKTAKSLLEIFELEYKKKEN